MQASSAMLQCQQEMRIKGLEDWVESKPNFNHHSTHFIICIKNLLIFTQKCHKILQHERSWKPKWKSQTDGGKERGKERDWSCGSQGENSINCLARHKIMLHYRLARLRKKPPNVAQGSALRCRDKDGIKRGECVWARGTDGQTAQIRATYAKKCLQTLCQRFSVCFPSVFPQCFSGFSFRCFSLFRCCFCCCCW